MYVSVIYTVGYKYAPPESTISHSVRKLTPNTPLKSLILLNLFIGFFVNRNFVKFTNIFLVMFGYLFKSPIKIKGICSAFGGAV